MHDLFYDLLKISVGRKAELSFNPTEEDWKELFKLSQQQTLAGVVFEGVKYLPQHQLPPKDILLKWYAISEQIKKTNINLNQRTLGVCNKFLSEGFQSVILKGQGLSKYYPNALVRTPGDIDIWLDGGRKKIAKYVRRYSPKSLLTYHHIEFDAVKGVDVEVHFTPTWMNDYFSNRRLQRYFEKAKCDFFSLDAYVHKKVYDEIPCPTDEFNRVFILVHIYRHFFFEGIGLRQILDYYYILSKGITEQERLATLEVFKELKMLRFVGAVMYVLQNVFGLEDKFLLLPSNKVEGEFLLNEIMMAGNFGHYDLRNLSVSNTTSFHRFINRVKRSSRFIFRYPSEAIWNPFFKIFHFFYWRREWSWRLFS